MYCCKSLNFFFFFFKNEYNLAKLYYIKIFLFRVLCNNEEHICQKLCYQECGPCYYPVEQLLDCGHKVMIECHIDPTKYDCIVQVKTVVPCGHEVDKPCFRDPKTFECPAPCAVRVEPCGHACTRSCHIRDDPDHLNVSLSHFTYVFV